MKVIVSLFLGLFVFALSAKAAAPIPFIPDRTILVTQEDRGEAPLNSKYYYNVYVFLNQGKQLSRIAEVASFEESQNYVLPAFGHFFGMSPTHGSISELFPTPERADPFSFDVTSFAPASLGKLIALSRYSQEATSTKIQLISRQEDKERTIASVPFHTEPLSSETAISWTPGLWVDDRVLIQSQWLNDNSFLVISYANLYQFDKDPVSGKWNQTLEVPIRHKEVEVNTRQGGTAKLPVQFLKTFISAGNYTWISAELRGIQALPQTQSLNGTVLVRVNMSSGKPEIDRSFSAPETGFGLQFIDIDDKGELILRSHYDLLRSSATALKPEVLLSGFFEPEALANRYADYRPTPLFYSKIISVKNLAAKPRLAK